VRPSTAELLPSLEAAVGPVRSLQRTASPHASTATLETVRARLADGSELDLVLKSAGRDTPREVAFYREVLAGAGLGTPRFLAGSERGTGWLLLAALAGGPLWQSADLESWCQAARWLGRAHRRLVDDAARLRPGGRLPLRGPAGAGRPLRRPRRGPARLPAPRPRPRLRAAPRTVVHGEAFPSNVLLGPAGELALVDWETAGHGPGVLDLAALSAGWPPAEAARIASAYAGDAAAVAEGAATGAEGAATGAEGAAAAAEGATAVAEGAVADALSLLPAARLAVAVRWLGEPLPAPAAGGGHARRTDWWAEAAAAAELLP
jgi:aminoglycoside phosphotransferase